MSIPPFPDLIARIDATIARGLACDALQPIATSCAVIEDAGRAIQVRWVSSLAQKDVQARPAKPRAADFNPFLPPDPQLTVGPVGDAHILVLNKFPVMARHALLVTREFIPQTSALDARDFAALAAVMGSADGLAFYNGGPIAGASQPHKHLQWIPGPSADPAFLPLAPAFHAALATPSVPAALPCRHVLKAIPTLDGSTLYDLYRAACEEAGIDLGHPEVASYNLLLTPEWMLLVPRRAECWEGVSLNAMSYAGLLFVREPALIEKIRAAGPAAVLAAGGHPR